MSMIRTAFLLALPLIGCIACTSSDATELPCGLGTVLDDGVCVLATTATVSGAPTGSGDASTSVPTPDPVLCDPSLSDECCTMADRCGLARNDTCDCGGFCEWEAQTCADPCDRHADCDTGCCNAGKCREQALCDAGSCDPGDRYDCTGRCCERTGGSSWACAGACDDQPAEAYALADLCPTCAACTRSCPGDYLCIENYRCGSLFSCLKDAGYPSGDLSGCDYEIEAVGGTEGSLYRTATLLLECFDRYSCLN